MWIFTCFPASVLSCSTWILSAAGWLLCGWHVGLVAPLLVGSWFPNDQGSNPPLLQHKVSPQAIEHWPGPSQSFSGGSLQVFQIKYHVLGSYLFLSNLDAFYFFSFLTALISTMLTRSDGGGGTSVLLLILRESFQSGRMSGASCGVSLGCASPLLSPCFGCLYHGRCWILSNSFSDSLEMINLILSFLLQMH